MIRMAGLSFDRLPEEEFDHPLGLGSGAGAIFGTSGGVMEAAIRTVYEVVTGKQPESLDFTACRGHEGIKEATLDLDGTPVKVAITNGLKNARVLMDKIRAGEADYQFIEVMCCPGGCVGGGGQPFRTTAAIREHRMDGLYKVDKNLPIRQSHKTRTSRPCTVSFCRNQTVILHMSCFIPTITIAATNFNSYQKRVQHVAVLFLFGEN